MSRPSHVHAHAHGFHQGVHPHHHSFHHSSVHPFHISHLHRSGFQHFPHHHGFHHHGHPFAHQYHHFRYTPGLLGSGFYPSYYGLGVYPGYYGVGLYPGLAYRDYSYTPATTTYTFSNNSSTYYPSYRSAAPAQTEVPRDTATYAQSRARISVFLPDADAQLAFDGHQTSMTGQRRLFQTPEFENGTTHAYTLTATFKRDGREVTESRQVTAVPGSTSIVDFTRPVESK
jgi:uncharacterized protein (TIGR03000 family)